MLSRYLKAAMQHATYEPSPDHRLYSGRVPGFLGVAAQATTEAACRVKLRAAFETRVRLRLGLKLPLPPVDRIPWTAWMWI
jgi:hypothetical protein